MASGKKYFWLKLRRDFFKRHDIRIMEKMPNGPVYVLLLLKLMTESIDHEGYLRFSRVVPYTEEMLSVVTETDIAIVHAAMEVFQWMGLVEVMDEGTIHMKGVDKLIGNETDYADQKRRQRGQCPENVHTEIEIDKEIETEIEQEEDEDPEPEPEPQAPPVQESKPPPGPPPKKKMELDFSAAQSEKVQGALVDFSAMRVAIKKPMTQRAVDLAIMKLEKMAQDDTTRIEIINQSIMNNWQDLYALKQDKADRKPGGYKPSNVGNFKGRDYSDEFIESLYEDVSHPPMTPEAHRMADDALRGIFKT